MADVYGAYWTGDLSSSIDHDIETLPLVINQECASEAGMNSVTLDKAEIKTIEKNMLEARLFTLQLVDFIIIIETSAMQRIMQTVK